MAKDNLQRLIERREQLSNAAAALLAMPESERPQKPSALKAWLRELEGIQSLIEQIDKLIERVSPKPRIGVPDVVPASNADHDDAITVARVRKSKRAEIRVTVKPWQGRRVVDVRLWSQFDGQGDAMKPSRKGLAFDATKLEAIIDALHQAKQHV